MDHKQTNNENLNDPESRQRSNSALNPSPKHSTTTMTKNDPSQLHTQPFNPHHQFVGSFPGFVNVVPGQMTIPNLYPINVLPTSMDSQAKRRKRTNYRDPENAAKLTTALGILLRQKEENRQQDLKAVAAHFGLPYNTLRDNYLKITTGKLTKGEKKSPDSGSGSSSNENTPRERSASTSALAASAAAAASLYGNALLPKFESGIQGSALTLQGSAAPYPLPLIPGGMGSAASQTSQHQGGQQVVHFIAATPIGYQFNSATGALVPVYVPAPNSATTPTSGQFVSTPADSSGRNGSLANLIQHHMHQQQVIPTSSSSGNSGGGNISMLLSASTASGKDDSDGVVDGPDARLQSRNGDEGSKININNSSSSEGTSNATTLGTPSLISNSHASQFGIHIPPLTLPSAYSTSMSMSSSAPPSKSPNHHPLYLYSGGPLSPGTGSPHPLLSSTHYLGSHRGDMKGLPGSTTTTPSISGLTLNQPFTYMANGVPYVGGSGYPFVQFPPPPGENGGHLYSFLANSSVPPFPNIPYSVAPLSCTTGHVAEGNSSSAQQTGVSVTSLGTHAVSGSNMMDATEAEVAEVLSYLDGSGGIGSNSGRLSGGVSDGSSKSSPGGTGAFAGEDTNKGSKRSETSSENTDETQNKNVNLKKVKR